MKLLMLFVLVGAALVSLSLPQSATAADTASPSDVVHGACKNDTNLAGCDSNDQKLDTKNGDHLSYLQTLINGFLYVSGFVSFLFIVIGGIRYVTSTGDATRITKAKETLLYAIIGLIISILALPISTFVIKQVG